MSTKTQSTFDVAAYKAGQLAGWEDTAEAWRDYVEVSERQWRSTGERLLELAGVKKGDQVLDVATGPGEPALIAARRVGDGGRVVGTDLSPKMLAIARQRANAAGLENVAFEVVDADAPGLPERSFDAAVCRWGVMFFADLNKALTAIRRSLLPGGRFAACAVGPPDKHPMLELEQKVLLTVLELPPPPEPPAGAPGFYSLADPSVLDAAFHDAGFADVRIEPFELTYVFESGEEFAQWHAAINPFVKQLISQRPERSSKALHAVAAAADQYRQPDGKIRFGPDHNLYAVGTRPRDDL